LQYVQYYIDLAADLLQSGHYKPFLIALSRAATRMELSQSKGGFLRKEMNTFTSKNINEDAEPPKKSLFGGQQKQQGGY